MTEREKRFVQSCPITAALEDSIERDTLVPFFGDTILPLEITSKKIKVQIIVVLENLKIIGPGGSVLSQMARNKIVLDGVVEFLEKNFEAEWTERRKKD